MINILCILLIIYSNKCISKAIYVPGIVLGAGNMTRNKTNQKLVLMELASKWKETDKQKNDIMSDGDMCYAKN